MMKKAIIVLSVLLAILLILAAFLYFSEENNHEESPETMPISEEVETMQQLPEETTAATETQPQIEVTENDAQIVLNGMDLPTFLIEGSVYVGAEEFAEAAGLTLESVSPLRMNGRDTVEYSEEGWKVSYNGTEATVSGAPVAAEEKLYLPFEELISALAYPEYIDEETGVTYYTPSARPFEIPEGVDVPVLMYHAVSDDLWGIDELFVSPEDMEEQLAYLVENDFDPIWFEDLAHIEDYDKPVILTFDDGYDDNYLNLFPLLQKYNVKVTIFVIGNAPGVVEHKMNPEQIRQLSDSGLVSIQSHSYTHADMDTLDAEETEYEMVESKRAITRITGKEPYVLCYPTGKYNDYTLEYAPKYFLFGLKMTGGQYNTSDDPYRVSRYYVSRFYGLSTFAGYLTTAGDTYE